MLSISSIHRYNYDYVLFIFCRYIFRAICRSRDGDISTAKWRKFLACLAVVGFVFLWHGSHESIILWSLVNILCFEMEIIGKAIAGTQIYFDTKQLIGGNVLDRIIGIFGSQLLMVSVLVNVYLIGGEDVGKVIARRTFISDGCWNYLVVSTITYCFYQSSEFLFRREDLVRKELLIAYAIKKIE